MFNVTAISNKDNMWNSMIKYVRNCPWQAGEFLAEMMEKNQFQECTGDGSLCCTLCYIKK